MLFLAGKQGSLLFLARPQTGGYQGLCSESRALRLWGTPCSSGPGPRKLRGGIRHALRQARLTARGIQDE